MAAARKSRRFWVLVTFVIIAAGILSRVVHTGVLLFDKYLGDALYAAMFYAILRIFLNPRPSAVYAATATTMIELFQLTLIPARLFASPHPFLRLCARLLGVQFSFLDLLAYAVGIASCYLADPARASSE